MNPSEHSAEDVGRLYDVWLAGGGGPSAVYARWYLRHRQPREYVRLLDVLGTPAPRLLDVGCATGVALEAAYGRGWGSEVLAGVDASERALTEAGERLSPLGACVRLCRGAADALPFASGSFDVATCNGVIKYLDGPAFSGLLAEVGRVLVPGGAFALGEFGPRVTERYARLWRIADIERWSLRSAAVVVAALDDAGYARIAQVEVPRIRRFPYSYIGVVAHSKG